MPRVRDDSVTISVRLSQREYEQVIGKLETFNKDRIGPPAKLAAVVRWLLLSWGEK